MKYYYLKPTDIVELGDEFGNDTGLGWCRCNSGIGKTVEKGYLSWDSTLKVRRKIKFTRKGNQL